MSEVPCPKCSGKNLDHYPKEGVRFCLDCGIDSFVVEGTAFRCERPKTGDGGWFIPAGIARELEKTR